jgi:hypothetical protein
MISCCSLVLDPLLHLPPLPLPPLPLLPTLHLHLFPARVHPHPARVHPHPAHLVHLVPVPSALEIPLPTRARSVLPPPTIKTTPRVHVDVALVMVRVVPLVGNHSTILLLPVNTFSVLVLQHTIGVDLVVVVAMNLLPPVIACMVVLAHHVLPAKPPLLSW